MFTSGQIYFITSPNKLVKEQGVYSWSPGKTILSALQNNL